MEFKKFTMEFRTNLLDTKREIIPGALKYRVVDVYNISNGELKKSKAQFKKELLQVGPDDPPYIHTYTQTHTNTRICTHAYIHAYIHAHIHANARMYTRTRAYTLPARHRNGARFHFGELAGPGRAVQAHDDDLAAATNLALTTRHRIYRVSCTVSHQGAFRKNAREFKSRKRFLEVSLLAS